MSVPAISFGWDGPLRFVARGNTSAEPLALIEVRLTPSGPGDIDGDIVTVLHTETTPAAQGRGIASALTTALLDELRRTGRRVVAVCPYTKQFLTRHGEYADLLA